MLIRVEQGKGKKDRNAILSPVLLKQLREWWRYANANNLMLKGGWLFPGQQPINPNLRLRWQTCFGFMMRSIKPNNAVITH